MMKKSSKISTILELIPTTKNQALEIIDELKILITILADKYTLQKLIQ